MREIYYAVMNIIMSVFDGWFAVTLFRTFAEPKARGRLAKYGIGVFWTALNIVCYFVFDNAAYEPILIVKLIIYTLGSVLFSVLWYRGGVSQRVFPALLFAAVRELSAQMCNSLTIVNSFILDILWAMADSDVLPLEVFPPLISVTVDAVLTLITVLRGFIIYRVVKRIVKDCRFRPQPGRESLLYMLPSTVGLMVCAMLRLIFISIENGYTTTIYSKYPLMYIIIPAASALLLASVVYSFRLHQETAGLQRMQADRAVLENQLTNMQSALAEKERLYESFRAVRHDMRNSISALRGLIGRKCPDDEEINSYFDSMSASFGQTESRVNTGNAVCDAIIGGKFGAAESDIPDIRLDADEAVFSGVTADPYDIGVILSNGLDNAAEACRRLKKSSPDAKAFITVRSFRQKNMFFIEIENSFDGIIRIGRDSGLPSSLKEGGLHGIGLRNIKACAEKYSGSMELIVRDSVFTLSVMLKAA